MHERDIFIALTGILLLGVSAQWLAWRLRVPSIILLLLIGFVAGPITGFLDPDALMGELLQPFVSISVGIILFEGGLSLRLEDLRQIGKVLRRLVSVGAVVTWLIAAGAAYWILGLDLALAVLLGSILVVTGPTVIIPLLRHVGPIGRTGSILRWEGILIDPIGATLAVLVFEAIVQGELQGAATRGAVGFLMTAIAGMVVGLLGAGFLMVLLRREWLPEMLQNPMTLMAVVTAFTAANLLQPEAGLLATTVMGIVLANQKDLAVHHIAEFKENLQVLLLAALFILLAARLDMADISGLTLRSLLFVAALVLVARPLSVLVSTVGSNLSRSERLFLAWIAPRGVVAAAVTSIFALRLEEAGYPGAEQLVPIMFLVIVSTVLLYGLTASPVAGWLGLKERDPQGLLFVGAHGWAQEIASMVQQQGFRVLMVDTNSMNVELARERGLEAHERNILSEQLREDLDLNGIGRLLALTPSDKVNSLAALNFAETFGRDNVYQLALSVVEAAGEEPVSRPLRGRIVFAPDTTYAYLEQQFAQGASLAAIPVQEGFEMADLRREYGPCATPLFLIDKVGNLTIYTRRDPPRPRAGQTLVALVCPDNAGSADLPASNAA